MQQGCVLTDRNCSYYMYASKLHLLQENKLGGYPKDSTLNRNDVELDLSMGFEYGYGYGFKYGFWKYLI